MPSMLKRDAVKSTIVREKVDCVPYFVTFTPEAIPAVCEYFGNPDIDQAVGNYVYPVSPVWWDWHGLTPEDFAADPPDAMPKTRGTGSYERLDERLAEIRETTGCYILACIWGSHFEKAYFSRGIENFLMDMAVNKSYAKRLLDTIITKNLVMIENLLAYENIDGIILGSDWGSQRSMLMSPDVWRELIAPGEVREYDLIKSAGKDVWVHSCGHIEPIIPDLIDMGVDVLNPIQPEAMDIHRLKQLYGEHLTFWGGISTQQTLPYGTPADVKEEAREVIGTMSAGGGYIASPAQAIQGDVPLENVIALLEEFKAHAGNRGEVTQTNHPIERTI